MSKSSYNFYSG